MARVKKTYLAKVMPMGMRLQKRGSRRTSIDDMTREFVTHLSEYFNGFIQMALKIGMGNLKHYYLKGKLYINQVQIASVF